MPDKPDRYGDFTEFLAAVTAARAVANTADAAWLSAVGAVAGTGALRAALIALGGLGLGDALLGGLGLLAGPVGMLIGAGFFAFSAYSLYQTLQELRAKADPVKALADKEEIERARRIHAELAALAATQPQRANEGIDQLFSDLVSGRSAA